MLKERLQQTHQAKTHVSKQTFTQIHHFIAARRAPLLHSARSNFGRWILYQIKT
jgi:hypothetical protein